MSFKKTSSTDCHQCTKAHLKIWNQKGYVTPIGPLFQRNATFWLVKGQIIAQKHQCHPERTLQIRTQKKNQTILFKLAYGSNSWASEKFICPLFYTKILYSFINCEIQCKSPQKGFVHSLVLAKTFWDKIRPSWMCSVNSFLSRVFWLLQKFIQN